MSGIVCVFNRDQGLLRSETVETATNAIAHRGPHGSGVWTDERIGLGHQKLQTTPEGVYDEQPEREDGLVVVSDARVDNRDELLQSLDFSAPPARIPDSHILLEAYREWGHGCVERLNGSFSFVVWDADARTVFCARDHFGVKPLYYYLGDDLLAVASEPKALLSIPTVPTDVDDLMIADFLMHRFEGKTRSYFDSVKRLAPAHAMTISAGKTETWQYWDLDPTRTVTLESDAAYERRFRELFEQAVGDRLRTSGEIGADLSGGLDSSTVTVIARHLLPDDETLHTFSDVYDDAPSSDEREFIELIAERDGIEPNYVFLDDIGVLIDIDEVLRYLDHPPHNATHFGKWTRAKHIDETGVRVHLKGEQGDETVSHGFGYLSELLIKGRWLRLNRELEALGDVMDASRRQLLVNITLPMLVPSSARRLNRKLRGNPSPVERANPTLNPTFARNHDLQRRYNSMNTELPIYKQNAAYQQYLDLTSGRNTTTFETIDLIDAAFGIEPRYPFTDVRLVEFALATPPNQQLSDGYTRSILRRSVGDMLPEKIQWRPWKTMPGEAVNNALRNEQQRLQRFVENPEGVTKYLDEEAIRASYARYIEEESNLDRRSLTKALSLSAWLAKHGAENDRR